MADEIDRLDGLAEREVRAAAARAQRELAAAAEAASAPVFACVENCGAPISAGLVRYAYCHSLFMRKQGR